MWIMTEAKELVNLDRVSGIVYSGEVKQCILFANITDNECHILCNPRSKEDAEKLMTMIAKSIANPDYRLLIISPTQPATDFTE